MDVDIGQNSPAPLTDSSDSDDAVNTSSAKVYFGPVQSPEKKFAPKFSRRQTLHPRSIQSPGPSSLRRSPRLSSSPIRGLGEEEYDDHADDRGTSADGTPLQSRDGTPVHRRLWEDEPSSALASRIIRAHDNPSPPPDIVRTARSPFQSSKLINEWPSPLSDILEGGLKTSNQHHISDSEQEEDAVPNLTDAQSESLPSVPSMTIHDLSPSVSNVHPQNRPQENLIQFDQTVDLSPPAGDMATPQYQSPTSGTVDDLLCGSPMALISNDREVMPIPSSSQSCHLPSGLTPITSMNTTLSPVITSPRRSSRPSVSLAAGKLQQLTTGITPRKETLRLAPPSSQKRKRDTKGKEKIRYDDGIGNVSQSQSLTETDPYPHGGTGHSNSDLEGRASSPMRRRERKRMKIDLGEPDDQKKLQLAQSLSPDSAHVLATLVTPGPSPAPDSDADVEMAGRWTTAEAKGISADSRTSRDAFPIKLVANLKPSMQQPLLSPPLSLSHPYTLTQTSHPEPSVPFSRSPVKAMMEPASEDPTRTPARRVLISKSPYSRQLHQSTFHPLSSGGPVRTPARRVLTSESPRVRQFNPSDPPPPPSQRSTFVHTPVFTRPIMDDLSRSPTRKTPVAEATVSGRGPRLHLHVPLRSRSRSTSAEPPQIQMQMVSLPSSTVGTNEVLKPPALAVTIGQPSGACSGPPSPRSDDSHTLPSTPGLIEAGGSQTRLRSPSPGIVEKDIELDIHSAFLVKQSSSIVVHTKPPPNDLQNSTLGATGSRIPRIGTVPKSIAGNVNHSSKLLMPSSRKTFSSSSQPTRLPSPIKPLAKSKSFSTTSSGSDDSGLVDTNSKARIGLGNSGPGSGPGPATAASRLKRKRGTEKSSSPPHPLLIVRQVIPGMFGGPTRSTSAEHSVTQPQASPSPTRKVNNPRQGPIKIRKVVKGTLQDYQMSSSKNNRLAITDASTKDLAFRENESDIQAQDHRHREQLMLADGMNAESKDELARKGLDESYPIASSPSGGEDHIKGTRPRSTKKDAAPEGPAYPEPIPCQASSPDPRRATRLKKVVPQDSDVFGAVSAVPSAASTSRRKNTIAVSKSRPGNISTMPISAHAWKTLTNTNTAKNQQYYINLETLIVRKPGDRPESPSMKLRTVLQKQKEEQGKKRAERAQRRRGQSDYSMDDAGDSSMDGDFSVGPPKHPRGPGDEEDYETPDRPEHDRKRVKWDRGLVTTMYLDEVEVRVDGRHRNADWLRAGRKSCLAKDAQGWQNIPLDPLGNVPSDETSLNLVPEKVVVTKFVYDNDEVPEVVVVKQTRSKAKKGR